jgi:RNA polymerase sigma-70 factor (ECF subfamily)
MNTPEAPRSMLEQISTCWPSIRDPIQFVMRYAQAIRRYVGAIVRDPHDAEEVTQEFLVRVFEKGFCPENVSRGRFRDYLRAAVRYVALDHLRRKRPALPGEEFLAGVTQPGEADEAFAAEWRRCLLDRAWQRLESHQRQTPGNFDHWILRIHVDDPEGGAEQHATRLAEQTGKSVRTDAYRKQLSRARRRFAQFLVVEIRRTLQTPTAEAVERARRIVALFEATPDAGVIGLDGEMLDRPHLLRARRLLDRAR